MRDKGHGLMVSAIIVAGLLLRPVGSSSPQRNESIGAGGTKSSVTPQEAGVGPWIASCDYWAPARQLEEESKRQLEVHHTLDATSGRIALHVNLDETDENKQLACGGEPSKRWGFPPAGLPINATAIIATVPDPVHSHLAVAFDRGLDAILQAAADNGYVSSNYWLPWKNHAGSFRTSEAFGDAEPGHDPERERQPGLLILKYVPESSKDKPLADWSAAFYNVVYVFLVAETPTKGVDGFQLQRAFSYEADLESALASRGDRFTRGRDGSATIIGPTYSGSAASLRAGTIGCARMSISSLTCWHGPC